MMILDNLFMIVVCENVPVIVVCSCYPPPHTPPHSPPAPLPQACVAPKASPISG